MDAEVDTDEWMGKHSGTADDDDAMVLLLADRRYRGGCR